MLCVTGVLGPHLPGVLEQDLELRSASTLSSDLSVCLISPCTHPTHNDLSSLHPSGAQRLVLGLLLQDLIFSHPHQIALRKHPWVFEKHLDAVLMSLLKSP